MYDNLGLSHLIKGDQIIYVERIQAFLCATECAGYNYSNETFFVSSLFPAKTGKHPIFYIHDDDWGLHPYFESFEAMEKAGLDGDKSEGSSWYVFSNPLEDPLNLFQRSEWLLNAFLMLFYNYTIYGWEELENAPDFTTYEKERQEIAKYSYIAVYWLWAHALFGNKEALAETVALCRENTNSVVKESISLTNSLIHGEKTEISKGYHDFVTNVRPTLPPRHLSKENTEKINETENKQFLSEDISVKGVSDEKTIKTSSTKTSSTKTSQTKTSQKITADQLVEKAEIISIAELENHDPLAFSIMKKWNNDMNVYYYGDDTCISGDFELDNYDGDEAAGFVFSNDLNVEGSITQMEGDYGPYLAVCGTLKARNIDKGGSYIEIMGNCEIDGLIYGYYNHGVLKVHGTTCAEYIINDDHFFEFDDVDNTELVAEIDIYGCDLYKLFVSNLIIDEYRIDTKKARVMLDNGFNIFIDNWEIVDRDDDSGDEE